MKKNRKNKGFTLVELIVVLVILAILAAMLVPALTGYIDKANEKVIAAEARATLMAAQTLLSDFYGRTTSAFAGGSIESDTDAANLTKVFGAKDSTGTAISDLQAIGVLAELELQTATKYWVAIEYDESGKITEMFYNNGKYSTKYTATAATKWSTPIRVTAVAGE